MEVVRVGGGLEESMAGGDDPDNNQDTEANEIEDRKLVCMVRQTHVVKVFPLCYLPLCSICLHHGDI